MKKTLKGFTLVEVLIVIIIVGILIAALLPRLVGSQARSRDVARTAMVNQVANGIALFLNDAGTINPVNTDICLSAATLITGTVNAGTVDLSNFLASIPRDPQAGHTNGTGCNGSAFVQISDDGRAALVYANFEGTQGANAATPSTSRNLATFQSVVSTPGTDGFAVLVR